MNINKLEEIMSSSCGSVFDEELIHSIARRVKEKPSDPREVEAVLFRLLKALDDSGITDDNLTLPSVKKAIEDAKGVL